MAALVSGDVIWAFQSASYQRPPKVLMTVPSGAPCSPQPGRPRRQMPYWPLSGSWSVVGELRDLVPRGLLGHASMPGCLEQVLAIEQRRALAVERGRVELAVVAEAVADRLEEVGAVVRGVGVERRADLVDPAELGPQRDLVHAHGHHVERAGAGRDVRRHLRADLVLRAGSAG